ncbi:MAG: response regulator, partial [Desulfobacterales bacterium]
KPTYEELVQRIRELEKKLTGYKNSEGILPQQFHESKALLESCSFPTDRIQISGIDIEWDTEKGLCTFENLPVAMMWIDTTLAGFMSGVQAMVGTERFGLALQSEGRKSVDTDWKIISQFADFPTGFRAIANIAAVAGWGDWELILLDETQKRCQIKVQNSWEGLYQKALGVCWGSGMLAGKMAGFCSKHFGIYCWAEQTKYIAKGDEFDEFTIAPSKRTVEEEIENLLETDEATRADMAVALKKLKKEISVREQIENALRISEEKYRHLVENANDAIFILQDGKIKFANSRAKRIGLEFGIELDRVPFDHYIHPEDRDMVIDRHLRRLKGEKLPDTYAFRLIGRDGQEMWAELNAVTLVWKGKAATLNFLRDITVQRNLEKQLQLSQKMEAVGTLAGGVAHDFNNLLMAIQGRTSLMLLEMDRFHPSFEHLQEIEICIQKAAKLTKQLLGFARGGKYEIKPTDLNNLVENSAHMFGRTKKEIAIFKKYEENLWSAAVDQSQIDQVLLNIFVNAWQAMPKGGELYIQTKNEILDENFVRAYGVAPGKYIKISIEDTGIGMDEETMKRIFDPFFTTREKERGTGFGLASAYGIIKNHDGIIVVESVKDEGTTFHIYLPASEKPVFEEQKYEQKISIGSETVLLVDDESMIIDVSVQMLKKMGYEVLTAHNGREAIDIFSQNNDKVTIVVLDLVMPGMNGGEVYERLKQIDNNVKVLLSSGYSIDGQAAEILNRGCDGFIQKPFKLNELSYKLREIISKQKVKDDDNHKS